MFLKTFWQLPKVTKNLRKTSEDFSNMSRDFQDIFFFSITEQLQYFWINSNMKKKKCSDEEAQEKPQGLCELSFLKI